MINKEQAFLDDVSEAYKVAYRISHQSDGNPGAIEVMVRLYEQSPEALDLLILSGRRGSTVYRFFQECGTIEKLIEKLYRELAEM